MKIWSNKERCMRLQAALLLDYFWLLTNKPPHTKRVSLCSIKKKIVVLMSLFMILSQVPRYNTLFMTQQVYNYEQTSLFETDDSIKSQDQLYNTIRKNL